MTEDSPVPADWEQGFVEANGIELHYCRSGGSGPTFVISHGFTDDGYCRLDLAREMAADHDVVLYDARGHGRSDAPEGSYGAPERAADLLGLLDAFGFEEPILFGHSMGADTVTHAVVREPDRPRAVVLEDPVWLIDGEASMAVHDGPDADIEGQIEEWQAKSVDELLESEEPFSGLAERGQTDLARRVAEARHRLRPAIAGVFEAGLTDPTEVYGDITAPTLILKSDADERRRESEREVADHLPDGRIVHVDGAGHCVLWDERERATEELRSFLATV